MERFTQRAENGNVFYPHCFEECQGMAETEKYINCEYYDRLLKKFAEYEDADEQGLLLRLPVAIGSDVYFIPSKVNYDLNVLSKHKENNKVYHQKVARITFTGRGWHIECDKDLEYGTDHILVDKLYQETWFLTQEEAEQALAEMKGEN